MAGSFLFCFSFFFLFFGISLASPPLWSVFIQDGEYKCAQVYKPNHSIAWGYFQNEINSTGWGRLSIASSSLFNHTTQSYAVGYLEGFLTNVQILQNWENTFPNGTSHLSSGVKNWIEQNNQWMMEQIKMNQDPYWLNVQSVLAQLRGILDGYNAASKHPLDLLDIILLNLAGDLETLYKAAGNGAKNIRYPSSEMETEAQHFQHCSGLVKVTSDLSELYAAHTTWSTFNTMLRIYKNYQFGLPSYLAVASTASFPSYPGVLSSIDDFYVTSANLTVIETTNGFYVDSLEKFVKPESVLSWIRVIIANRMSVDGETWTSLFSQYNSGTYNNQWFVVNYNLFTPYKPLQPGTFWVIEQMPGMTKRQDMTDTLAFGYWPSYNIPYFEEIFIKSGFPIMVEKWGDWFIYELHPRAKIFRRDQGNIKTLEDMQHMMQYNDWQHDPYSNGNPGNQIASRFDLVQGDPKNPFLKKQCFGGIDSKVTSYSLMKTLSATAISGPTHQTQKPFSWSDWPSVPHEGHPEKFDFDWQLMKFEKI